MSTRRTIGSGACVAVLAAAAAAYQPEGDAVATGLSDAERRDIIDDARARSGVRDDLTLLGERDGGQVTLKFNWQMQLRYIAGFRAEPPDGSEDDEVIGFQLRRSKYEFSGNLAGEDWKYKVVLATSRSGGDVSLETALVSHNLTDDTYVAIGQSKLPFYREQNISSKRLLTAERSIVSAVFDQGFSQMLEIGHTQDRWRVKGAFSDGLRTANTDFTDPSEADYALTGRADLRFGEAGWKSFEDFTSFPGDPRGAMVGVAAHWEESGETGIGTTNGEVLSITADAHVEGGGWNAFVAGVWRHGEDAAGDSFDDLGAMAQAGFFVADQTELFGRFATLIPDGDRAGDDTFSALTAGFNHYFIPDSHTITLTGEVSYYLDATTGTDILRTSSGIPLLADADDGQVMLVVQLEVLF